MAESAPPWCDASVALQVARHFLASSPPSEQKEVEGEIVALWSGAAAAIAGGTALQPASKKSAIKYQTPLVLLPSPLLPPSAAAPLPSSLQPAEVLPLALAEAVVETKAEHGFLRFSLPNGCLAKERVDYRQGTIEATELVDDSSTPLLTASLGSPEALRKALLAALRSHAAETHCTSRSPGRTVLRGAEVLQWSPLAALPSGDAISAANAPIVPAVFLLATSSLVKSPGNFWCGSFTSKWRLELMLTSASRSSVGVDVDATTSTVVSVHPPGRLESLHARF